MFEFDSKSKKVEISFSELLTFKVGVFQPFSYPQV